MPLAGSSTHTSLHSGLTFELPQPSFRYQFRSLPFASTTEWPALTIAAISSGIGRVYPTSPGLPRPAFHTSITAAAGSVTLLSNTSW